MDALTVGAVIANAARACPSAPAALVEGRTFTFADDTYAASGPHFADDALVEIPLVMGQYTMLSWSYLRMAGFDERVVEQAHGEPEALDVRQLPQVGRRG